MIKGNFYCDGNFVKKISSITKYVTGYYYLFSWQFIRYRI